MEAGTKEKIIRESMRHILCIDDEFIGPYDVEAIRSAKEGQLEFSKSVYENLQNGCGSHVDILKYDRAIEENEWTRMLSDRDLLVLDWELEGENSESTLKIIRQALKQRIPFICIYTNSPNIEKIYSDIAGYFSGYSKETLGEICDKWESVGVDQDVFGPQINDLFAEREKNKNIPKKLQEDIQRELDFDDELVKKQLKELKYKEKDSWYPLYLKWNQMLLPEIVLSKAERTEKDAIIIDGMLIVCFTKEGVETENAVKPEQLLGVLAKNIIGMPNSIFDIIWLKYSNALRNITQNRIDLFSQMDARALGYFSKNLLEDEEEFNHSMKTLFRDEIMDALEGEDTKLEEELIEHIKESYQDIIPGNIAEQIAELNEKIMMNHIYSKSKHLIDFGDILESKKEKEDGTKEREFWLCITAKCDCCRPQNIEYDYLFVKGTKKGKYSEAIKDAEGKQQSFVSTKEGIIVVSWKELNLRSIYITSKNNVLEKPGDCINGNYRGENIQFTYLGNMKENYTQRVANEAFSHANRVGITLAQVR